MPTSVGALAITREIASRLRHATSRGSSSPPERSQCYDATETSGLVPEDFWLQLVTRVIGRISTAPRFEFKETG